MEFKTDLDVEVLRRKNPLFENALEIAKNGTSLGQEIDIMNFEDKPN